MLNTLLASRAPRQRSVTAHAMSVAVHATLIGAAVLTTQQIVESAPADVVQRVTYVPAPVTPTEPVTTSLPMRGFRMVLASLDIPNVLPKIDISQPVTNPDDYMIPVGVAGGDPKGAIPDSSGALTEAQVDVPARLVTGSANPVYPEQLRAAGLQGDVQTTFVIDTTGRADMRTFRIVASTHARFSESATRAVASAKFAPAQVAGQKVRQWVLMPFVFSIK